MQNDTNEVIFEDFSFAQCLRRPAAWFSAYEYAATCGAGGATTTGDGTTTAAGASSSSSSSSSSEGGARDYSSCIIVDSGFSFSHVLPFVRGKCIKKSVKRVNIGGKLLTNYLKELVSYRQWNMMEEFPLVDQVKEELCYVAGDFLQELQAVHDMHVKTAPSAAMRANPLLRRDPTPSSAAPTAGPRRGAGTIKFDPFGLPMKRSFVMPDYATIMRGYVRPTGETPQPGQQDLTMETERFTVPEVLFNPSDVGMDQGGIGDAVCESVSTMDVVDAGMAAANLVLTGGNVKYPGFAQRLYSEARPGVPDMYDVQVFAPDHPEFYAWQGAERFVQSERHTGVLQHALVTRAEYLEKGSAYINEKFWRGW